jgi:hypothetical protein
MDTARGWVADTLLQLLLQRLDRYLEPGLQQLMLKLVRGTELDQLVHLLSRSRSDLCNPSALEHIERAAYKMQATSDQYHDFHPTFIANLLGCIDSLFNGPSNGNVGGRI